MTFEEKEQCIGYYGFGSGHNDPVDGYGYCMKCEILDKCWDAHKERMHQLYPKLVEEFEVKSKEMEGVEVHKWWLNNHGGVPDPYTLGMAGNMEDASFLRNGGKPRNRGLATLPYPFNVKN